mmetsp:Transcript_20533/g.52132  ORF Transcript_20533/g.52132 Transcript_20533/m.52132 type:complete len:422 (+) Transcript_20533:57-1322(+)
MYHEGFRKQTAGWSDNPVDHVVAWLRQQNPTWIVADFGCGEAKLAQSLPDRRVYSFDLVKHNDFVTVANCAEVPLKKCSIHVAVFCLALMGTDWPSFIKEAHRCLCRGGILEIYEVASRVQDPTAFAKLICNSGFKNIRLKGAEDNSNKFFSHLRFVRKGGKRLRACSKGDSSGIRSTQSDLISGSPSLVDKNKTKKSKAKKQRQDSVSEKPPRQPLAAAEDGDSTAPAESSLSKSAKRRLRRENAQFKQTKEYRAQASLTKKKEVKKEQLRKARQERAAANAVHQQKAVGKFRLGSKKRRLIRDLRAQGKHQEADALSRPPTQAAQPVRDGGATPTSRRTRSASGVTRLSLVAEHRSSKAQRHRGTGKPAAAIKGRPAVGGDARDAGQVGPPKVRKVRNHQKGKGKVDSSVLGACVYKRR